MTPKAVLQEVTSCITLLIEKGLVVDQCFPHMDNTTGLLEIIPDKKIDYFDIDNQNYEINYEQFRSNRQYTVIFFDGALLYISYVYKDSQLVKQRVIYYPNIALYNGDEYYEEYSNSETELFLDILNEKKLNIPLRFDYSPEDSVPGSHSAVHLHLGFIENCRISVSSPLTPKMIFQFILFHFYAKAWRHYELEDILNPNETFERQIDPLDMKRLYLDIKI